MPQHNTKPRASSFDIRTCGHCPNVHIVLKDEHDVPFADMTLGEDQIDKVVINLHQALARAKAEYLANNGLTPPRPKKDLP
jgi:hypothetical protein